MAKVGILTSPTAGIPPPRHREFARGVRARPAALEAAGHRRAGPEVVWRTATVSEPGDVRARPDLTIFISALPSRTSRCSPRTRRRGLSCSSQNKTQQPGMWYARGGGGAGPDRAHPAALRGRPDRVLASEPLQPHRRSVPGGHLGRIWASRWACTPPSRTPAVDGQFGWTRGIDQGSGERSKGSTRQGASARGGSKNRRGVTRRERLTPYKLERQVRSYYAWRAHRRMNLDFSASGPSDSQTTSPRLTSPNLLERSYYWTPQERHFAPRADMTRRSRCRYSKRLSGTSRPLRRRAPLPRRRGIWDLCNSASTRPGSPRAARPLREPASRPPLPQVFFFPAGGAACITWPRRRLHLRPLTRLAGYDHVMRAPSSASTTIP